MAILHSSTLTPSKAELIAGWLPAEEWAPDDRSAPELVGSYRFDDPQGRVGLEVHLVRLAGVLLQVPLTYRDAPLDGADAHLVGTTEHSVLGTRWVYDGLADPVFLRMLAAVTLTGAGQAVGLVEYDGRWLVVPPPVKLRGGGGSDKRVPIDGFVPASSDVPRPDGRSPDGFWVVLRSDRFELRFARRPEPGEQPPIGLTATWAGQESPLVLAELAVLDRS